MNLVTSCPICLDQGISGMGVGGRGQGTDMCWNQYSPGQTRMVGDPTSCLFDPVFSSLAIYPLLSRLAQSPSLRLAIMTW